MRIVVTGAGGFVGAAVARRLAASRRADAVVLTDRVAPPAPDDPRFSSTAADLTQPGAVRELVADADAIIHLASVPGGAAEADYEASRQVNLDASLALLETLA